MDTKIDTKTIIETILSQAESLMAELFSSIDNTYTKLIRLNFSNLTSLVYEYSLAFLAQDEKKISIKKESIEHSIASVISISLTAVNELIGNAKNLALSKLSELLAFFSTQLIFQLNTYVTKAIS